MIRFAYPNVDFNNRFIGCGRYFTAMPDDPKIGEALETDDPQMGSLSQVLTVASMLAPKSFDTDYRIYEEKDEKIPYLGDSKGLAYLLALIHRGSSSRWEKFSQDIWCTGNIYIMNDKPYLKEVFSNLFREKMEAFLSQPQDHLFIIPLANFKKEHRQMAESLKVRIISLKEFRKLSDNAVFDKKTILFLHGNELETLVRFIFGKSSFPLLNILHPIHSGLLKYSAFSLLILTCLFALFRADTIGVKAGILFWKAVLAFSPTAEDQFNDPIIGMTFIRIPGGCFEMGCTDTNDCLENETPAHMVCLDDFYMSRTEVTQRQWERILEDNPSLFSDCGKECPVESLSWEEAQDFIKILNHHSTISGYYRLPTEAEWEYVCKKGNEDAFRPDAGGTYAVGTFCSDALGLCDIKGNVLEWCEDSFQESAFQKHGLFNPLLSGNSEYKMVRGRSWSSPAEYGVCTRRFRYGRNESFSDVGFRLVWEEE